MLIHPYTVLKHVLEQYSDLSDSPPTNKYLILPQNPFFVLPPKPIIMLGHLLRFLVSYSTEIWSLQKCFVAGQLKLVSMERYCKGGLNAALLLILIL